jgi:predicted negative regulator of RcsB-dependent stress response
MSTNKEQNADHNFEAIESTLSKSEQFIEKNQTKITIVVGTILAIVGLYIAYQKFIKAPKEKEALAQMFVAEQYFEVDSFKLALNGDGNYPGFSKIIDQYGSTKAGNLAKYYAGVSYIKLKEYDKAIDLLQDFSTSDEMLSAIAIGCIGDAYTEKNDLKNAVEYYSKAADKTDNKFSTPIYLMKLGRVYEHLSDFKNALNTYQRIKDNYAQTQEGRQIEKYITRVKLSM